MTEEKWNSTLNDAKGLLTRVCPSFPVDTLKLHGKFRGTRLSEVEFVLPDGGVKVTTWNGFRVNLHRIKNADALRFYGYEMVAADEGVVHTQQTFDLMLGDNGPRENSSDNRETAVAVSKSCGCEMVKKLNADMDENHYVESYDPKTGIAVGVCRKHGRKYKTRPDNYIRSKGKGRLMDKETVGCPGCSKLRVRNRFLEDDVEASLLNDTGDARIGLPIDDDRPHIAMSSSLPHSDSSYGVATLPGWFPRLVPSDEDLVRQFWNGVKAVGDAPNTDYYELENIVPCGGTLYGTFLAKDGHRLSMSPAEFVTELKKIAGGSGDIYGYRLPTPCGQRGCRLCRSIESSNEALVYSIFHQKTNGRAISQYPVKSTLSGKVSRYDGFDEILNAAVEYDGHPSHHTDVKQIERDNRKDEHSSFLNRLVIRISQKSSDENTEQFVCRCSTLIGYELDKRFNELVECIPQVGNYLSSVRKS